jgi:hypothetical protein
VEAANNNRADPIRHHSIQRDERDPAT